MLQSRRLRAGPGHAGREPHAHRRPALRLHEAPRRSGVQPGRRSSTSTATPTRCRARASSTRASASTGTYSGDRSLQLRAGLGFFSGRTPGVWVSNAYGNTGMEYVRFTCYAATVPAFNPDPNAQPSSCAGSTSLAPNEINTLDPKFKMPQVWRANLASTRAAADFVGTLEGLYTGTVHDILYRDLSIEPDRARRWRAGRRTTRATARRSCPSIGNVYDLTNTDRGYSYSLTAGLQRRFMDNYSIDASYTYSEAKDVAYGGSSQASSNFRYRPSFDPNNPNADHLRLLGASPHPGDGELPGGDAAARADEPLAHLRRRERPPLLLPLQRRRQRRPAVLERPGLRAGDGRRHPLHRDGGGAGDVVGEPEQLHRVRALPAREPRAACCRATPAASRGRTAWTCASAR